MTASWSLLQHVAVSYPDGVRVVLQELFQGAWDIPRPKETHQQLHNLLTKVSSAAVLHPLVKEIADLLQQPSVHSVDALALLQTQG